MVIGGSNANVLAVSPVCENETSFLVSVVDETAEGRKPSERLDR